MDKEKRFTPQTLMRAARAWLYPREKMQSPNLQNRFTYNAGPMMFLGQQIVSAMQRGGYPAKIVWCYRSPEKQRELYAQGRTATGSIVTHAKAWESAHQYSEAVDIVHPWKGWDVPPDYWEALASAVRIVADKYGVDLEHGHNWKFADSAHIELSDWRDFRNQHRTVMLTEGHNRPPSEMQLWERFMDVLPDVSTDYLRRKHVPPTS